MNIDQVRNLTPAVKYCWHRKRLVFAFGLMTYTSVIIQKNYERQVTWADSAVYHQSTNTDRKIWIGHTNFFSIWLVDNEYSFSRQIDSHPHYFSHFLSYSLTHIFHYGSLSDSKCLKVSQFDQ